MKKRLRKWRRFAIDFLAGNAGENVTIGVMFAILILTLILLINFTNLSLVPFLIITAFATLFGTYAFAQWIGRLRDQEYRRECLGRVKFPNRKKRRLHNITKDNLPEQVIDKLVRRYFEEQ